MGIILIAVGLLLLVERFVPDLWDFLLPLLLVAFGIWLLWRARSS